MKRFLPLIAAVALAAPAFSGTTYQYKSETSGIHTSTMTGTVSVEGKNLRMDVAQGDGTLFKNGVAVISNDGGKTLAVVDPSDKTWFELKLEEMLGGAGSMLKTMGDAVKISFDNQKVDVRDAGAGETIEGYPTRKSVLNTSYDVNIDAMGQKMTTRMSMKTESWSTDKVPVEAMNFFQVRGIRTGIEGMDKLIEAQGSAMKGRFPLKQVTTLTVISGGRPTVSTTTATVSNIEKKAIAAAQFVVPAGYTKTENPLEKMMAGMKGMKH